MPLAEILNDSARGPRIPAIIAEVGSHHNGDVHRAMQYIDAAKGLATAVKFQAIDPAKLAAPGTSTYWQSAQGDDQLAEFARLPQMRHADWIQIINYAHAKGMEVLFSAFDPETVQRLDPFVGVWKVASGDITNQLLLEAIADTGKPVIMSTGGATDEEIKDAVAFLSGRPVCLLHCVLSYPATHHGLERMSRLRRISSPDGNPLGRISIGYSDHVPVKSGWTEQVIALAGAMGAAVYEKHFSLTPGIIAGDHYHAMGPDDLRSMVSWARCSHDLVRDMPGAMVQQPLARRSLALRRSLEAGERIDKSALIALRPEAPGCIPANKVWWGVNQEVDCDVPARDPWALSKALGWIDDKECDDELS